MRSRKNRVRHLVRSAVIGVAPLASSLSLTSLAEAATNARWNAGGRQLELAR